MRTSLGERTSIKKNGQSGGNFFFCSAVSVAHCSGESHDASGARFALLPPDNATGNYIKVVQRIPVLIRFDGDPQAALRPGMSADVVVDTRAH